MRSEPDKATTAIEMMKRCCGDAEQRRRLLSFHCVESSEASSYLSFGSHYLSTANLTPLFHYYALASTFTLRKTNPAGIIASNPMATSTVTPHRVLLERGWV